ncbi:ABC transporter permease [Fluviicola taffensis]|uniref:ABC-2 type transporter n=1 Tax=Fluviicola taffensis (strain DSM 16823 / NCIMB 13979 / RW262) TaxID=755732 RepID=F2IEC1_FLUTR|nr:ABC transporter permease [Fluviicola taffensis]AEA43445.1 ABC-2 type transporter [Fluviicola taffensis DSM 16823]
MRKLRASIWKEILLVVHDKVGLLLMYLMPLLLVFIITIVQDSAFQIVNENQLTVLISNQDEGTLGDSLVKALSHSGSFDIKVKNTLTKSAIKRNTIDEDAMLGIYIPPHFSKRLGDNADNISKLMLVQMGVIEKAPKIHPKKQEITIYFDPVVQENFRISVINGIQAITFGIENEEMVSKLFAEMGYDSIPKNIRQAIIDRETNLITSNASLNEGAEMIPNSSQHNVPAWSIFAMFFMVISLGGNIVKERLSGSFLRLQTIPQAFVLTLVSKFLVYLFVALSQLLILFLMGIFIFPHIGLPKLAMPNAFLPFLVVTLLSAISAISYAVLVGTYAKTQEQANGFGAISIIIFAAIGGIWIPNFVMPDYMQKIGNISPLKWCLEGYYTLFLKNGAWSELIGTISFLFLFTLTCQLLIFIKLRIQNYI